MHSPTRTSLEAVPEASLSAQTPLLSPVSPLLSPVSDVADRLLSPAFVRVLLAQLTFGLAYAVYFLMPKYSATELHARSAEIGAVSSTAPIVAVLLTPFVGRALDRVGRRPLLLAGAALSMLVSAAMVTVHEVGPWLYFLRGLHGVAFSLGLNALASLVADLSPAQRLGQAMGLLGVASLVSSSLSPPFAEVLAERHGWHAVFVFAALAAVAAIAVARRIEEPTRPKETTVPTLRPELPLRIIVVAIVMGAAFGTVVTFVQPLALERGAHRVATFFMGFTCAAMFPRVFFGGFADRFGRRRVAFVSMLLYGVATTSTAWLTPGSLFVYGTGVGLAHGLLYPSLAALAVESSPPDHRGQTLTYFSGAFNAGSGVAMLTCGAIAHFSGYPSVFILAGALTIATAFVLRGSWGRARSNPDVARV